MRVFNFISDSQAEWPFATVQSPAKLDPFLPRYLRAYK